MRIAIISDLHANENAFRSVLADARSKGVKRIICLGDIVGYGPLPNETANLARLACAHVIAGNHDDAVTGRMDAKDFIDLAGEAVKRHREILSSENLDWLRSLGHVFAGDGFIAAHGDFTDPEKFYYIRDESDARVNFEATDAQLMFVGHTHTPRIFLTGQSGKVYTLDPTDFVVEDGKRYIVNPGSVGYPRETNGTCFSSYVIYDSDAKSVTYHYLPFAVSSVLQRGQTPKKVRKIWLFSLIALFSALIGTAVFFFTPKTEVVEVKQQVIEVKEDQSLVIQKDNIPLTAELKTFLPNLKLKKGSVPMTLRVIFKGNGGEVLNTESIPVKKSRTKATPIPNGATHAEITLLRQNPGDRPQIDSYKPAFKP